MTELLVNFELLIATKRGTITAAARHLGTDPRRLSQWRNAIVDLPIEHALGLREFCIEEAARRMDQVPFVKPRRQRTKAILPRPPPPVPVPKPDWLTGARLREILGVQSTIAHQLLGAAERW